MTELNHGQRFYKFNSPDPCDVHESNSMYLYVQIYLTDKTSDVLCTLLTLMSKLHSYFLPRDISLLT